MKQISAIVLALLAVGASILAPGSRALSAAEATIFAGGFEDAQGHKAWRTRFGGFSGDQAGITPASQADLAGGRGHAEAQRNGALGADFTYEADLKVDPATEPHLQFRISDVGRYGVRLRTIGIAFYRFGLDFRPCDEAEPSTIAHCPSWKDADPPNFGILAEKFFDTPLPAGSVQRVTVRARDDSFEVLLNGTLVISARDSSFKVGRFGIYAIGRSGELDHVGFSNLRAVTDPTEPSNFALLYSTAGYDARGTKRALVRTLNNLPRALFDPSRSHFVVRRSDGSVAQTGALVPLAGRTFGMQLWEADFSLVSPGDTYFLEVEVATPDRIIALRSAPFPIAERLASNRLTKQLSLENAEVRRAADEDFWRNWIRDSGSWSVGLDGAFIADRADSGPGALIWRVFNIDNEPLQAENFKFFGRITIVSGCDAQMRFQIQGGEWFGVTLQAGDAGSCRFGSGPGAVRLHHEGPGFFTVIDAKPFSPEPFQAGRPYDMELRVNRGLLEVYIDGKFQFRHSGVPARTGRLALMAWSSTVRFEDVQAWQPSVEFKGPRPNLTVRIPTFENDIGGVVQSVPCQYYPLECRRAEDCRKPKDKSQLHAACNPLFAQLHGFHDSNSNVGEATSHGSFLAGLMELWTRRAHEFSPVERESLRRAIMANALYLEILFQQGSGEGEFAFAHSEMGRVAVDTNLGRHNTEIALYGSSAFADEGQFVDRALARNACQNSRDAATQLWPTPPEKIDAVLGSIVFARLARCTAREGLPSRHPAWNIPYEDLAVQAAERVLDLFSTATGIRDQSRDTGRVFPWFEGVWQVQPYLTEEQRATFRTALDRTADILVSHLTRVHPCDEGAASSASCPANGFFVLPQASGEHLPPGENWVDMGEVPRVERAVPGLPYVHFYEVAHFATSASEAAYLGLLTGRPDLERVATGNLYWALGLNPGVPASKVVGTSGAGTAWRAASFIYRLNAPFARAHDGFRIKKYSAKGWLDPWEDGRETGIPGQKSADSPLREAWRIDPQNRFSDPPLRDFLSIVNGHVLWDDQWDYWNVGEAGWASGESFIRNDGLFLKAALLMEDWLYSNTDHPNNPHTTDRVQFFNTTHIDRAGTGWGFDDPERAQAAYASRAATEFCTGKGYSGGRFTGHHVGEKLGVLCAPTTARFFDATDEEIEATGWSFDDINAADWAQAARAATGFCNDRNYVGGFLTGHQLNGRRGIICLGSDAARWFNATDQELFNSGEGFGDINAVLWAKAARAATNICVGRGYSGGFFTGHQVPGFKGVVCFAG